MKYLLSLFIIIFFTSCSVKYSSTSSLQIKDDINKIEQLNKDILSLSKKIDKDESKKIAQIAILYSKQLANEYDLVTPPLYHNSLVQAGLRKRGLCFHFAQDLIDKLKKQNLKTLDLRWVVHAKKDYWEHSSIVISFKGKPIQDGIILDAWRNSGKLYWNNFGQDIRYTWIEDIQRSKLFGTIN